MALQVLNIGITLALAATLVACTSEPERREGVLEVSPRVSLLDEAVHIRVTGLSAGQRIELSATGPSLDGTTWSASATFRAGDDGVVDLERDAPESGDYTGVDAMGLVAAMTAPAGAPAPAPMPAELAADHTITVAVTDGASAQLSRVAIAPGVTYQQLTAAEHGVAGILFTPAQPAGAGVLLIGGAEGGVSPSMVGLGLMLAAHGYPALALAYFDAPGLPGELRDVPVEYFAAAATKLPGPVRVVGVSRGSEAALLLSSLYPELVAGTVVAAPPGRINLGFPNGGYAWTYGNVPRLDIPYNAISSPVLAVAGTSDTIWPSADNVTNLGDQLGDRLETLVVEGAGHDVLGLPYLGTKPVAPHPVIGEPASRGGDRQTNEQARRQSWAALLAFLGAA